MTSSSQGAAQDLLHRLRRANGRDLVRLVEENSRWLGIREVRQILLNPFVGGEAIEELAMNRKLTAAYEVRCALARHRRTPQAVAMRFVAGLVWRDLMEVSADTRIQASVRRLAEKYLAQRLSGLSVGERVSLARRASAETAAQLAADGDPRVVRALLANPRLSEERLLPTVSHPRVSPRLLDLVARDERWGCRYPIKVALCRNPQTPFRVLFELLPALRRDDLESVTLVEAHSSVVLQRARELLSGRPAPASGKSSPIELELGDNHAG